MNSIFWHNKIKIISSILFAVLFCSCIQGCVKKTTVREKEDISLPSFVSTGNVNKCDCIAQELYLAQAALGLSPLNELPIVKSTDDLREKLQTVAMAVGGKLTVDSLDETLYEMSKAAIGPRPLSIIVHRNGHLYGLLGTIEIEGFRLFQLVHGSSQVWLATKEQLDRAGYKEVWHFERRGSGVPIRVGDGEILINKVYENFGEIKPQQEVKGTFLLENKGKKTVILGVPQTSCSCIVPSIKESVKLEPGTKKEMEVILHAGASTSTRQIVVMKCYEEGSGASQSFPLELLGNQRRSMEIVPTSLDFGLVVPGKEVIRTIMLKEMPTDRFTVSKIDVGQLPLTFTQRDEIAPNGLKYYETEIKFVLKDDKIEGKQEGMIEFTTDSKQFPRVKIPVLYEVPPVIRAIPSIASFGTVTIGAKAETDIEFESRDGKPVEVKVESLRDGVTFEKNDNIYRVGFTAQNKGIFESEIKLVLISNGRQVPLSLKCVAFVRSNEQ